MVCGNDGIYLFFVLGEKFDKHLLLISLRTYLGQTYFSCDFLGVICFFQ